MPTIPQQPPASSPSSTTTGTAPNPSNVTTDPSLLPSPDKPTPAFSPSSTTVIFVLGGPGAGKGTQCSLLVRDFDFVHLSAGDLLRAEQERPGSQFGELIRRYIKEGTIVPMEVTVALLENAMAEHVSAATHGGGPGVGRFLIDGFPRKMDQAVFFEEKVCPSRFVLFFDCSEETMLVRLLGRAKTSGREDDNEDTIRKRFRTFEDTTMPVVRYFEERGKLVRVDAGGSPDEVYETVKAKMRELGVEMGGG